MPFWSLLQMSMGTCIASTFRWLWIITLLWTSVYMYLCFYIFSVLLGVFLKVEFLDHIILLLILKNHHTVFCKCKTTSFYIATAVHKGPGFFHILCNTWYFPCLHDRHPSGCEPISHCGFYVVLVLLNIFLMCLLAIHVSSLEKCVFESFAHWWIRLFYICEFRSSLYSEY